MDREAKEERRALTILWRIQNFSYWEHGINQFGFESEPVQPRTLDGRECVLSLLPSDGGTVDKHLLLSFSHGGRDLDNPIDFEWSFLDTDDSPLATGTVRNRLLPFDTPLDLPDCPTEEEVFETRKSSFLPRDTLTVRCRIWKSDGELAQAEHFSLLSRIEASEHSLVWPIEGFSTLQIGQSVTTTEDTVLGEGGIELKISLTGASLLDSKINFDVIKSPKFKETLIAVKVSVLDNWQNAIAFYERKIRSCYPDSLELILRKELLEKKSECLRGDVLSLLCVFTCIDNENPYSAIERTFLGPSNLKSELLRNNVINVSETSCQNSQQSPRYISQERNDSLATLGEDFLSLYRDPILSDFELRSGGVSFPIHKIVLSARSPVFRDMFSRDMNESDILDVPDVDIDTLNRMLIFLYGGTVDSLQWEAVGKLYYAADKYQVQSLKQQCSSFLQSGITVSNASEILTLADRHLDPGLTSFVHDFILEHDDEILQTVEWENFLERDSGFAAKTMLRLYKKLKNH